MIGLKVIPLVPLSAGLQRALWVVEESVQSESSPTNKLNIKKKTQLKSILQNLECN